MQIDALSLDKQRYRRVFTDGPLFSLFSLKFAVGGGGVLPEYITLCSYQQIDTDNETETRTHWPAAHRPVVEKKRG